MKTYFNQSIIAVALSVVLAGLSTPVFAERSFVEVNFADLNLAQPSDVAALYERIQVAARQVCKDDTAIWGYHRRAFNRCFERTMDKAVIRIDNPALTSLHLEGNQSVVKR